MNVDKANQTGNPDEIWVVDSETSKQYIINVKTGQVVREIGAEDDKPI